MLNDVVIENRLNPTLAGCYESVHGTFARITAREFREIAISCLTNLEREMIFYRYGLSDGAFHTLKEVGDMFGVTAANICHIENRAFHRIARYHELGYPTVDDPISMLNIPTRCFNQLHQNGIYSVSQLANSLDELPYLPGVTYQSAFTITKAFLNFQEN